MTTITQETDRCECCGKDVNLQWVEGFLLCRYAASALIHDGVYPKIKGRSVKSCTSDALPLSPLVHD